MARRNVCNVKLRSFVLLQKSSSTDVAVDGNNVCVTQSNRTNTYPFDICLSLDTINIDSCLLHLDSSVSMALLGFNSTVMMYNTCTYPSTDSETPIETLFLVHALQMLFERLNSQRMEMSHASFQYEVSVKCFEVMESQVRDLLSEDSRSYYAKQKATFKPRLFQKSDGFKSLGIEGLSSTSVSSSSSCVSLISDCFKRRCCLARGSIVDGSRGNNQALMMPEIIGNVGNVIVDITVRQLINQDTSLTKESVLQIVSLAPSDILSYRPTTSESVICLAQCELSDFYTLHPSITNNATSSLLNTSLKSLSTLTRVVQTLKLNHDAVDKKAPVKHVPYRDCLLTRLLQHSLHGNCYLSMFTFVGSTNSIDSVSRTLRFASDIGGLHNRLYILSSLLPALARPVPPVQLAVGDDLDETDPIDDDPEGQDIALPEESVQTAQFMSLFDMLSSNMNLLASELNKINTDLLTNSLNSVRSRKEYSDSRNGVYAVNEEVVIMDNRIEPTVLTEPNLPSNREESAASSSSTIVKDRGELIKANVAVPEPVVVSSVDAAEGDEKQVETAVDDSQQSLAGQFSKSKTSAKIHNAIEESRRMPSSGPAGASAKQDKKSAQSSGKSEGIGIVLNKSASTTSLQSSSTAVPNSVTGASGSSGGVSAKMAATPRRNSVGVTVSQAPEKVALTANHKPQRPPKSTTASSGNISAVGTTSESKSGTSSRRGSQSGKTSRNDAADAGGGEGHANGSTSLPLVVNVALTESRKTGIELGIFSAEETGTGSDPPSRRSSVVKADALPAVLGPVSVPAAPEAPVVSSAYAEALNAVMASAKVEVFVPPKVDLLTAKDIIRIVHPDPTPIAPSSTNSTSATSLPAIGPDSKSSTTAAGSVKKELFTTPRKQKPLPFLDNDSPILDDDGSPISFAASTSRTEVNAPGAATEGKRVLRRRKVEENDDDSGGDNLTEAERKFLRACASGQVAAAQKLLSAGVNVHVKNNFDRDGMQICARNGSIPMLELLRSWGGDMSSRGPKGDTLFHLAAYNGHVDTLRWLHGKGAVVESVDAVGQTAVHYAARRGEISVLVYGHDELQLDMFQEDFEGKKPLDCIPFRGVTGIEECKEYLTALTYKMQMIEMLKNKDSAESIVNTV